VNRKHAYLRTLSIIHIAHPEQNPLWGNRNRILHLQYISYCTGLQIASLSDQFLQGYGPLWSKLQVTKEVRAGQVREPHTRSERIRLWNSSSLPPTLDNMVATATRPSAKKREIGVAQTRSDKRYDEEEAGFCRVLSGSAGFCLVTVGKGTQPGT